MTIRLRSVLRSEATEGGDGSGVGADPVFDDAPAPPKSKMEAALPPKPVKAKEEPAKPEPKPKPKTQAEKSVRDDKASEDLAKFLAKDNEAPKPKKAKAEGESKPEPKPDDKPTADKKPASNVDADDKSADKTASKKPDPKPAAEPPPKRETTLEHDQALLRATQQLRNAEAVTKKLKTDHETAARRAEIAEKKLADLQKRDERWGKPEEVLDVLFEHGYTLERLVVEANEGKLRPPKPRAEIPEAFREEWEAQRAEMETLRKEREQREQERVQTERRKQFDDQVTHAKGYITKNADAYPVLAACEWIAADIVGDVYRTNNPDMAEHAARREAGLLKNLTTILGNESALSAIAKSAPDALKQAIAKAFDMAPANDNAEDEEEEPEAEVEEDDEDEDDDKPAKRVAVKTHSRKPASRVSNESTPKPKVKGMDRTERAAYANSLLEKFIRENKR